MTNRHLHRSELYGKAKELRLQGKRIVTINGAFDLCHIGHIRTLKKAKELGDVLIVGVNSDSTVRFTKGADRPLINENDRMETLLSLECVDYVHFFCELTPEAFLEEVRPDIHVNSSEYGKEPVEKKVLDKHGCKLYVIANEGEISTSSIIRDIKGADRL
jgi:rfaE bifunctional protein nucleotidyltransferase chain/domain